MVYADYNGSAPLLPSVKDYLKKRLDSDLFANPNAIHSMGQKISMGLEKSRSIISEVLGSYPDQIIFTSGATEGISTILHSALKFTPVTKKIVITSKIEHSAVLMALASYEKDEGYEIKYVQVDQAGRVDLDHLKALLEVHAPHTALVALMAANNETGTLQSYERIARICNDSKVDFFCDTTQLIGKDEFHFEKSGIDFAVVSGHKLGALSGTGLILAKDPTKIFPLIFGHQEKELRGGTQNYLGIETLAVAFSDFKQEKEKLKNLKKFRLAFEKNIKKEFPNAVIIADLADRLPGTTLLGYPGLHGQAVQIELESHDVFVTTSAACSDNQPETSEVLRSMGISDDLGRSVVRISLSYSHGEEHYHVIANALKSAYNKLTRIKSF